MTEISEHHKAPWITEKPGKPPKDPPNTRYSVNPTAFIFALICAPLIVTALSFWTIIGFFALPMGIIPYLVIGTPTLIWAVGRIKPRFGEYAWLGFCGNAAMIVVSMIVLPPVIGVDETSAILIFGCFGMIFAPLYAGTFGWLYAAFHPNIRILQT